MIVIGVDPGSRITGFAVIEHLARTSKVLCHGTVRPSLKMTLEKRYYEIFCELDQIIKKFKPKCLSVETQFVHKNVQSAIKLGMARGACLLAAAKHDILVKEYTPTLAKKSIVGKGHASKAQIQKMVQILLNLKEPLCEDTSDACALALCHVHTLHLNQSLTQYLGR